MKTNATMSGLKREEADMFTHTTNPYTRIGPAESAEQQRAIDAWRLWVQCGRRGHGLAWYEHCNADLEYRLSYMRTHVANACHTVQVIRERM
jgi:hypothetical protein